MTSRTLAKNVTLNFLNRERWLAVARHAPTDEFERVDAPFARFTLVDVGMRFSQTLTHRALRQTGGGPPLPEESAELPVLRAVDCACSHLGDKLSCAGFVPIAGTKSNG